MLLVSSPLSFKGHNKRSPPHSRFLLHHPPEVLCQIFHYAVEDLGIKRLLPLLHVCYQWRRSILGDSSLWTEIYLSDITPPLFDMILAYAGKRLLKVHANHPDIHRVTKLWGLVNQIEELECWSGTPKLFPFLTSLGPAPNLKVFQLRDGPDLVQLILPKIFRGRFPSLRQLCLAMWVTWPAGLFKNLRSFELGIDHRDDISPTQVLDVLRESPLLENLHLTGDCDLPDEELPTVVLASLKNCILTGNGALSLVWYMDIPASANVTLRTSLSIRGRVVLYPFRDLSLALGLHTLDEVTTTFLIIGFAAIRFQAKNDSGGVVDIQVFYHENVAIGATLFAALLEDAFFRSSCRFQTTKEFAFHISKFTNMPIVLNTARSACFST